MAHGLDEMLKEEETVSGKVDKYFREGEASDRRAPRTILADLDPKEIEKTVNSNFGHNYTKGNIIQGNNSANLYFPKGFYTEGEEIIGEIMDKIRKEVELCDSLEAFELCLGMSGGTGSGLGSLILKKLKDEYSNDKKLLSCFCNLQSESYESFQHFIYPYNTGFSLQYISELADLVYFVDNEGAFEIFNKGFNIEKSKLENYKIVNNLISETMETTTCNLRHESTMNSTVSELAQNLVTLPKMKFLTLGFNRGILPNEEQDGDMKLMSDIQIYSDIEKKMNFLTRADISGYKLISGFCCIKDHKKTPVLDKEELAEQGLEESLLDYYKLGYSASRVSDLKAGYLMNHTCIVHSLAYTVESFNNIFRRKAGIWEFLQEGMDEIEFEEAMESMKDTLELYKCQ